MATYMSVSLPQIVNTNNCSTGKIFECGSFGCKAPPNSQGTTGFDCLNGYGCYKSFGCSSNKFACKDNNNFNCWTSNECKTLHECGGANSKFKCTTGQQNESYTCKSNFTCANSNSVTCPSGQYTCKNSVSCNPNGSPFTPPEP